MAYSFAPNDQPLYVSEGDYVQFRFKAPPQWDFTRTVTVQIGDLTQLWLITTVPEDFTPDPYPFQKVDQAELDTLYTYADGNRAGENITVISGLTPTTQALVGLGCNLAGGIDVYAMRIDYDGDGTWDTDWTQGDGTERVENGARIQIRGKTDVFNNQPTRVTLAVGTANEVWTITTKSVPLNQPEPFPDFDDLVGEPVSTVVYSEVIRINGLNSPGLIALTAGEWAISSTNTTSPDITGRYEVLDGATFSSSNGTVTNGDYLQLRILSDSQPEIEVFTDISIGDITNGSRWSVTTENKPVTNPNFFQFDNKSNVVEDALISSGPEPEDPGISGLGLDPFTGESVSVPVILTDTDSTEVKIKINDGSIGVFPTTVKNDDKITLYMRSAPDFNQSRFAKIKVGDRDIPTWTIITSSGPDYDALFTPPSDKVNQPPETFISSSPITISDINRPITIESIAGYNALISIDFDTPVVGPRTFDPAVNTSFYIVVLSAPFFEGTATPESTTIVVGTEATDVAAVTFTWTVSTYAFEPPPASNLGVWYSKKTSKFDGYPIGTILSILKENIVVNYGNLSGELDSRYPGFIECDGRDMDPNLYPELYNAIKTKYGGTVNETITSNTVTAIVGGEEITTTYDTTTYTGTFNLPDYRNRRICGIGVVDSSRGNSAFLSPSQGTGAFDVGASGGYWYFDRVDVGGSEPLEQITGTGQTGLVSDFFSLGTVRVDGLETITDDISFTITGSVFARIGPLSRVIARVPEHEHQMVSAVAEGPDGDPLIEWDVRALFSFGTNPSIGPYNEPYDSSEGVADKIAGEWAEWLSTQGEFSTEMQRYEGDNWVDLLTWVKNNLGTSQTANNGGTLTTTSSYMVWWISDVNNLPGTPFLSAGASGNVAGCIDVRESSFVVDSYAAGEETSDHNHMITENVVGNPQTDFTGGNDSGPGIIGAPYGSGLGGAQEDFNLTFNQNDIFMDMTDATFQFSSAFKKPVPNVTMRPQRQVPIINPFHKTKYIIKAF